MSVPQLPNLTELATHLLTSDAGWLVLAVFVILLIVVIAAGIHLVKQVMQRGYHMVIGPRQLELKPPQQIVQSTEPQAVQPSKPPQAP